MNKNPKPPVGRQSDKFMLRFPDGMRDRIAELAKQNGRSMNAEIVQRLEWALSLTEAPKVQPSPEPAAAGDISYVMAQDIRMLADEANVPYDEMLATLILAGLHKDAPQVLYLPILPGATTAELRAALDASKDHVRPDAAIVSEMLQRAPWIPAALAERYGIIKKMRDEVVHGDAATERGPETKLPVKPTVKRVSRSAPKKS
jgi:hypothetical protein